MHFFRTKIILTHTQQIIILDLDYKASLGDQKKKRISQIGQTNKLIAHIFVNTNAKIEQEIKKCYDKRHQVQDMTIKKI